MDDAQNNHLYFHDRFVLLLLSINAFLALLTTVLVLLRLNTGHGSGYFIQYRANLGLNAYTVGSVWPILAFIVFAILIVIFHLVISRRIYQLRRPVSLVVLAFGTLLLTLTVIVSNALLVLR
jgi:uncharacterized membrane protein